MNNAPERIWFKKTTKLLQYMIERGLTVKDCDDDIEYIRINIVNKWIDEAYEKGMSEIK